MAYLGLEGLEALLLEVHELIDGMLVGAEKGVDQRVPRKGEQSQPCTRALHVRLQPVHLRQQTQAL